VSVFWDHVNYAKTRERILTLAALTLKKYGFETKLEKTVPHGKK